MSTEGEQTLPGRFLRIRGDVVKALRANKGWTAEDLARKTGCVKRTIDNAEAGRYVQISTARDLSKALGVEIQDICFNKKPDSSELPLAPEEQRVKGSITINYNFSIYSSASFNSLETVLNKLADVIGALGEIDVLSVREGSVIIDIEMIREEWRRLAEAFHNGRLKRIRVLRLDLDPTIASNPLEKDGFVSGRVRFAYWEKIYLIFVISLPLIFIILILRAIIFDIIYSK